MSGSIFEVLEAEKTSKTSKEKENDHVVNDS